MCVSMFLGAGLHEADALAASIIGQNDLLYETRSDDGCAVRFEARAAAR